MKNLIQLFLLFFVCPVFCFAQFPPAAGQAGTTAIYKDSTAIVAWASGCEIIRGWQNISDTSLGKTDVGDSSMATGAAGTNGVVSLGDGGIAILTFNNPVTNGASWDFAVFENSFSDTFLELAFVEVSSDGINYFRFPSTSLTDTNFQIDTFGVIDATKINNLAGKYRVMYGTPFDLQELSGISALDINNITHIKIIDVVGSIDSNFASYDAFNNKINDPWPTPFNSSGFDLDAVGVLHQKNSAISEILNENQTLVYPNPAKDFIYISLAEGQRLLSVSLLNINGKTIRNFLCENIASIDIKEIPDGIYILKITDTKKVQYKKIIKN